jgi:DNA-directed RNA polymerase specialized sigma24 family protein
LVKLFVDWPIFVALSTLQVEGSAFGVGWRRLTQPLSFCGALSSSYARRGISQEFLVGEEHMTSQNSRVQRTFISRSVGFGIAGVPQNEENAPVGNPQPGWLSDIIVAQGTVSDEGIRGASRANMTPSVEDPMEEAGVQRTKWVLTQEALQQFLTYLDPDQDRAGEKYEEIRRKLVTFFRCNGFWNAEDQVDETMDRVIRRLTEVEVRDLMPFIRGVARHVASEVHKRAPRVTPIEDSQEFPARGAGDEEGERRFSRRLECVYKCADRLPAEDREIILQYYQYDKAQKIENKRNLAAVFGITTATLRVRAFRVRKQLEKLVMECMKDFPEDET